VRSVAGHRVVGDAAPGLGHGAAPGADEPGALAPDAAPGRAYGAAPGADEPGALAPDATEPARRSGAATGRGGPAAAPCRPARDHPRRSSLLADLEAGRRRAAWPDPAAPGGWRADPVTKAAILELFRDRRTRTWAAGGALRFRDRVGIPPRDVLADPQALVATATGRPWRIVPGGTAIRVGTYLGPGIVVMPPSYVNVGAWIGEDALIDSHVLVGSCAQIGARVHLAAGVTIGGVLEPPGARPVIVEDDAFVGAGCRLLDGVLVRRGAVVGTGVTLTGTSRLYDLVRDRVIVGTADIPLVVPAGAVVVPGTRRLDGQFAATHGLAVDVALLVKDRDSGTDARVALEEALR
jgi:2,3,4,5-tetrahydropyridine-2-carboxylate N-succinyltransferase